MSDISEEAVEKAPAAAKKVKEVVEKIEEVASEEKVALAAKITELASNPWFRASVLGVSAATVGAGVGYLVCKRRMKTIVNNAFVNNVPEQITFPPDMRMSDISPADPVVMPPPVVVDAIPDRVLTPDEVEERVSDVVIEPVELVVVDDEDLERLLAEDELDEVKGQRERLILEDDNVIIPEPDELINAENDVEVDNVFAQSSSDDDWDWEEEKAKRHADMPYVIHEDEFQADEKGFNQKTLTFYQEDEVLVDESNVPIYNYSTATGPLRFGHGTNLSDVVHIRNEKLKSEYQIIRDSGAYAETQGIYPDGELEGELKHSIRKFRPED